MTPGEQLLINLFIFPWAWLADEAAIAVDLYPREQPQVVGY